jgi:hypothetical protein
VKLVLGIDDFNPTAVRKSVYNFYSVVKWVPAMSGLWRKVADLINFQGRNISLQKVLMQLINVACVVHALLGWNNSCAYPNVDKLVTVGRKIFWSHQLGRTLWKQSSRHKSL